MLRRPNGAVVPVRDQIPNRGSKLGRTGDGLHCPTTEGPSGGTFALARENCKSPFAQGTRPRYIPETRSTGKHYKPECASGTLQRVEKNRAKATLKARADLREEAT